MKIAVTRCDGGTEILTLSDPVTINEGRRQAHIHDASGIDHFFRAEDGYYDGWGMGTPGEGWNPAQGQTLIEYVQNARVEVPLTLQRFLWFKVRSIYKWAQFHWNNLWRKPGYPRSRGQS